MSIRPFAVLALTIAAVPAGANTLRFSTTAPGGILATGNTLGLSKDTGVNAPGVRDGIGTFITLDPSSADGTYPLGTTSTWQLNGSEAVLTLPAPNSELNTVFVLYAELLWGGSYQYGGEDVTADLDDSVLLSTNGDTLVVSPDASTAQTLSATALSGFAIRYYLRSADVTSFVSSHGSGRYAVEGVPATQADSINQLQAAGWTLVVAYRNEAEPLRNLTVFVGGSFVDENTQEDYDVDGFCAPPTGDVFGKVAISAIEGDASITGDQLTIAPTATDPNAFVNLEGPNNPVDNFFCSQLNDENGQLDTSGTFGTVNQDATTGVNVVGGRQGWDVTTVPVTSQAGQLFAGQQSAVLRTITTGDSYMPTLAAFQIDVNAPNLTTSALVSDHDAVQIGDTLTVTSTATNSGSADASSLVFALAVPAGTALASVTSDGVAGDLAGNSIDAAALGAGIFEGDLAPGASRTVVVKLTITSAPSGNAFAVHPVWTYDFVTCSGSAPVTETFGQGALVSFTPPPSGEGEGEGASAGEGEGAAGEGEGATAGEGEGEGAGAGEGEGASAGEGEGSGVPLSGEGEGAGNGTGLDGNGAAAAPGCGCRADLAGPGSPGGLAGAVAFLAVVGASGSARRRRRST